MRTTVSYFQKQKNIGAPITMLTAYDATSARLAEAGGIKTLLVGDSMGMVVQGHENTVPVTLENIIYHTQMVIRGTSNAFVISDLPFGTYTVSTEQAIVNATRCLQEGGSQSVKLEGGEYMAPTIFRLVQMGIPVLAHIGLTPQSVHSFGGWRVQGKTQEGAAQLIRDAHAIQDAGAYAVVLELVPAELARLISQQLTIPTIGIGAGPDCDGQVQVFHDILGLIEGDVRKHAKCYTQAGASIREGITQYREEVETRRFPTSDHAPSINDDILQTVYSMVEKPENASLPHD